MFALLAVAVSACAPQDRDAELVEEVDDATHARVVASGDSAASTLAVTLSGKLFDAISDGGPAFAIDFCAQEAQALAAAVASSMGPGWEVKRTSRRTRNPANAPDPGEQSALALFHEAEADGGLEHLVQRTRDGGYRYYRPLRIAPLCLECHGSPAAMDADVRQVLSERYPDDQATGYGTGELRGLIRVTVPASRVEAPVPLTGQSQPAPESIPALEQTVDSLRLDGSMAELGAAYAELAAAYRAQGREPEASDAFRKAIFHQAQVVDPAALARTLNTFGLHHWNAARYDSAIVHLSHARDIWTALEDQVWLGRVNNNIGATHYQWGNYEPALDAFLRSLAVRRDLDDLRGQSLVLTNIGRTYHDWQQYQRARAAFDEAIALAASAEDPFVQAYAAHNMGVLHVTLEEYPEARAHFEQSLAFYGADDPRISDAQAVSGWSLNSIMLGIIHVREGDPDRGIAVLEDVLAVAVEEGHARRHARALVSLGHAYRAKGDLTRAVAILEEGLRVAQDAGQRTLALEALADLGAAHEDRGEYRTALARRRAHEALRDSVFNQSAVQRIAAMEARAEADRKERENVRLRDEQLIGEAVIARQRAVVFLGGALLLVSAILVGALVHYNRAGRRRGRIMAATNATLNETNRELREALSEVRTLKGFIPICVHCKKVRDDQGYWEAVESYITSRSDALFSHSICADCGPSIYGSDWVTAPASTADAEP
jgi:tetratricopeptide (TPR) repeat protein